MLTVAAFYRFFRLDNPGLMQSSLKALINSSEIYGTIVLAHEGINGTVCGSRASIDSLRAYFNADPRFLGMEYKESEAAVNPFVRRHVKIKKEIVTMGQMQVDTVTQTGTHVDSETWDALLLDPSVLVIDVRNRYETAMGSFIGAHDPNLDHFKQFPDYVKNHLNPAIHKRIAMSCTGGIRCEKASSYLLDCGFEQVYQLKGGVLKYLEKTPKERSTWSGECFVFDHRVSVDHDLQPGSYTLCFSCRAPLSAEDKMASDYVEAVACKYCCTTISPEKQRGKKARHEQMLLAKARGLNHIGPHAMPKSGQSKKSSTKEMQP